MVPFPAERRSYSVATRPGGWLYERLLLYQAGALASEGVGPIITVESDLCIVCGRVDLYISDYNVSNDIIDPSYRESFRVVC